MAASARSCCSRDPQRLDRARHSVRRLLRKAFTVLQGPGGACRRHVTWRVSEEGGAARRRRGWRRREHLQCNRKLDGAQYGASVRLCEFSGVQRQRLLQHERRREVEHGCHGVGVPVAVRERVKGGENAGCGCACAAGEHAAVDQAEDREAWLLHAGHGHCLGARLI